MAGSVKPPGISTIKATMPIISKGAVSPSALAIPIIAPVNMPGNERGKTWCNVVWNFEAPTPSAASRIEGGTDFIAALLVIIIVGSVISAKTIAPRTGIDRGIPKKFIKIARPVSYTHLRAHET